MNLADRDQEISLGREISWKTETAAEPQPLLPALDKDRGLKRLLKSKVKSDNHIKVKKVYHPIKGTVQSG